MKRVLFFMLVILLSLSYLVAGDTGHELTVVVKGITSIEGQISIGLFNSSNDFPETKNIFIGSYVKAEKGSVQYTFENLPKGIYAVGIYHDKNMNSILDKGLFGIPKEGYAFSNNVFGAFGPPRFKVTSFVLESNKIINIELKY